MNARTKACAIRPEVKKRVEERDGHACIFCQKPGRGEAHVIPRSHGGLGIEQNLVTVCRPCHDLMDNTLSRSDYQQKAIEHLKAFYPGWTEDKVIYKKGIKTKRFEGWTNKNLVNNSKAYIEERENRLETKPNGIVFFEGDL